MINVSRRGVRFDGRAQQEVGISERQGHDEVGACSFKPRVRLNFDPTIARLAHALRSGFALPRILRRVPFSPPLHAEPNGVDLSCVPVHRSLHTDARRFSRLRIRRFAALRMKGPTADEPARPDPARRACFQNPPRAPSLASCADFRQVKHHFLFAAQQTSTSSTECLNKCRAAPLLRRREPRRKTTRKSPRMSSRLMLKPPPPKPPKGLP